MHLDQNYTQISVFINISSFIKCDCLDNHQLNPENQQVVDKTRIQLNMHT